MRRERYKKVRIGAESLRLLICFMIGGFHIELTLLKNLCVVLKWDCSKPLSKNITRAYGGTTLDELGRLSAKIFQDSCEKQLSAKILYEPCK